MISSYYFIIYYTNADCVESDAYAVEAIQERCTGYSSVSCDELGWVDTYTCTSEDCTNCTFVSKSNGCVDQETGSYWVQCNNPVTSAASISSVGGFVFLIITVLMAL